MRHLIIVLLMAICSHAYLIDLGLGPSWGFYTFDMPNGEEVTKGSSSLFTDFEYTDMPNLEVMGRLGLNPHDDFGTSVGDFNLFLEYAFHKNHVNYEYESYNYTNYASTRYDKTSSIVFHDIGFGFGGSLPHAIVNISIGYEYAYAYGGVDGGVYMKIGLGGYISSRDKTSYKGMLVEMDMIMSTHRFGISVVFGLHLNGTKDYTEAEIAEKEKEEEVWATVGTVGIMALGTVGAISASKGGGGGGSDYDTCRYGCLCNDGTISRAEHRQGACSWHGGISPYSY